MSRIIPDNGCVCSRCESNNTEWFPVFRNGEEVGQIMCYDCGFTELEE